MRRLIRSEFRKLTTTKMPLAFLGVLMLFAIINAFIVIAGTDMDGSKTFISTAADQQSLVAFASNGFILAALFGAVAVGGGVLSLVGTALTTAAVALALPTTD